ncbi:RNA-guided endonuclease TnpB family protein [Crocosphaera sp. XPORK-15E]|uniref:RNA-guided endonuclease InsQ/TnpB family protein n=1 Tax=Crocosphaera sp. XPORK-15E TaxID=3110247 RepID=UPI002B1EF11C|nr:RNA-guided endonuclease TnpB family protein [Crocosphaera sp. XPORK-15E]MEA5534270.1 RNA-guided endonuclease TnpB family protein [Crocosphaera sp. XPORK-15E]
MTERAYRFRFYPTTEQENLLRRTMGCVRLVYNKALAARTAGWYERQERIGYPETSSSLTEWKKQEDLDFLNEVSCVPLQQTLRHLNTAFTNFWAKRAKYPNFKKKRNGGNAEFTRSAFKWRDGQLWLAKCKEPLNIVWSRYIPNDCKPSRVTVKLDPSGRWFVSILVNDPTVQPLPKTGKKVGIDAGITSLITTSDGEKVTNPRHFNRLYKKLRKVQKALSRKTKGSNNRDKARLQVAKIHAQIKDSRTDFLHKLTTKLVRENDLIAIEDLAIRNMVKNRKLARSISDASWGEFNRQLEYKCQWYGKELIKIDRFFPSSKRCGNCGNTIDKLPLKIREWECPKCGMNHDRDINASKNILAAGLAVSVCGATIRPEQRKSVKAGAKKQKPFG